MDSLTWLSISMCYCLCWVFCLIDEGLFSCTFRFGPEYRLCLRAKRKFQRSWRRRVQWLPYWQLHCPAWRLQHLHQQQQLDLKGVIEKNGLPAADFNWGYGQAVVGWIFWESPKFHWHVFNIGSRVRGTRETTDPSPGVRSLRFLNNSLVVGSLRWMQTARVC